MKKLLITILCCVSMISTLFIMTGCTEKINLTRNDHVYYNGLYRTEIIDNSYYQYLRFYESGRVIVESINTICTEIPFWMHIGDTWDPDLTVCLYHIDDDILSFSYTTSYGRIEYEGEISAGGKTLTLNSSASSTDFVYNFYEME